MNEKLTNIGLTKHAYNKIVNDLRVMTVSVMTPEYWENQQVSILCTTKGKKLWIHNQEPCTFKFEYLSEGIHIYQLYCITHAFEFPVSLSSPVRVWPGDHLRFDRGELMIEMELTFD